MSAFCYKLQSIYNKTVYLYFATAVEYENYNIEANVQDSSEDIVGKHDFKSGMDAY